VALSLAAVIASSVDLATIVRMSLPRRAMHPKCMLDEREVRFVCLGWATVQCLGLLFLRESDCRGTLASASACLSRLRLKNHRRPFEQNFTFFAGVHGKLLLLEVLVLLWWKPLQWRHYRVSVDTLIPE